MELFHHAERHHQISQRPNAKVLAIENADHSLDIDGDIKDSLDAIHTAIEEMRQFDLKK